MRSTFDSLESRHEVITNQLELIEGWAERLPLTNIADRRDVMVRVVDFLQRYVLVDAAWEEEHLFPLLGGRAAILRVEHGFIARWVHELEAAAHGAGALDTVRFRRTTFKLIGLLEAHMHAEENAFLDAARLDEEPIRSQIASATCPD